MANITVINLTHKLQKSGMGKPIPYIQIVGSRLASTVLGTKLMTVG
ncbi:MAG: hypothetical protein FWG65_07565 [Turicibacter sp.]|nr:hypothetical protein [Turicibacter sp.]